MKILPLFIFANLIFHISVAQVGINTDTPEQALDVNGKIKIGDDTASAIAGTIRFNPATQDFEGFNGMEWLSLTVSATRIGSGFGVAGVQEKNKIFASDGAAGTGEGSPQQFGFSSSISGNYAIVGAPYSDNPATIDLLDSGAAYIYYKNENNNWQEQAKLLPPNIEEHDRFGWSVAINGEYALIGAVGDDDNGLNSGAVYVYQRDGTSWSQVTKLIPADNAENDFFGSSVDLDNNLYAIIGAERKDAAYLYSYNGISWGQRRTITHPDVAGDRFGYDVSIDDGKATVSSYYFGTYIFDYVASASTWPLEAQFPGGTKSSISGDYVITNGSTPTVYFFDGSLWIEQAELLPTDGSINGNYNPVDILGEYAVVSAIPRKTAYLFQRNNSSWTQVIRLQPSDNPESFGDSISLGNDGIIIGSKYGEGNVPRTGAAYIY